MPPFKIIVGLLLIAAAVVGGGIGTYHNLRNARSARERAFVIRVCLMAWALILSMLALAYLFPPPYRFAVLAAYFIVCPLLVYRWANTHQLIRLLDRREAEAKDGGEAG